MRSDGNASRPGGAGPRSRLPRALTSTSRRARWRRSRVARSLSALLAGLAVWLVVAPLLPQPDESGDPVVVAARDLPLGATVSADDLRVERRPHAALPARVLDRPEAGIGRVTSGPVVEGEVLTTVRFRGPSQLSGLGAGQVAVSVPLAEAGLLPSLEPADRVAVLVAGTGQTVAAAALVLGVNRPGTTLGQTAESGSHVVLALTTEEARAVAATMNAPSGPAGFVLALRAR